MGTLTDYLPELIATTAQSRLGMTALMILVTGAWAVVVLRRRSFSTKAVMYALVLGGLVLFGIAAAREARRPPPSANGVHVAAVPSRADHVYAQAETLRLSGDTAQARDAFVRARALYQEEGNSRGEANTLYRLGDRKSVV